mgnify:CR=1 FL=1
MSTWHGYFAIEDLNLNDTQRQTLIAALRALQRGEPEDLPGDLRGLIVASPANPSGTMLDRPALAALIEAAALRQSSAVSRHICAHSWQCGLS